MVSGGTATTGRLAGKVAIVTGASGGIGQAIVAALANAGARVVAADTVPPPAVDPRPNVRVEHLDVTQESDWGRLAASLAEREGGPHILVNNAGARDYPASISSEHLADWDRTVAVNQISVFLGIKAFARQLEACGSGAIVTISSIFAHVAVGEGPAYHASKAALQALTRHAAVAIGTSGVRVNSISPGLILTPATAALSDTQVRDRVARTALGRRGDPREVASAVLCLASDEASYITGSDLVVDGGCLAR